MFWSRALGCPGLGSDLSCICGSNTWEILLQIFCRRSRNVRIKISGSKAYQLTFQPAQVQTGVGAFFFHAGKGSQQGRELRNATKGLDKSIKTGSGDNQVWLYFSGQFKGNMAAKGHQCLNLEASTKAGDIAQGAKPASSTLGKRILNIGPTSGKFYTAGHDKQDG